MKVLVIGSGGREHAIVFALQQCASVSEIHALPGSAGIGQSAICHDISWKDSEAIIRLCLRSEINYVIIGPEDPLVAGLSDQLRDRGILVVGPSKDAAMLEGSKIFAKEFMKKAKVPTAKFDVVASVEDIRQVIHNYQAPFVLKADGLAAGKGVYICQNQEELELAAKDLFEKKILGAAGERALLEQFMPGWELSYLLLTNGQTWQTLPLAQDHKRLLDEDKGPNTGGMGTLAPLKIESSLTEKIETEIVAPVVKLLHEEAYTYRGVLFIGIMVTATGPQVLEFNCRLGDPETQVILPLIDGDIGEILKDLSIGRIQNLKFKNIYASCVVLAAPGYPYSPEKNIPIEGDPTTSTEMSYFLHAGTRKDQAGHWLTNGGRVLNAIGIGTTLDESLAKAYQISDGVKWMGQIKRKDIGRKAKNSTA